MQPLILQHLKLTLSHAIKSTGLHDQDDAEALADWAATHIGSVLPCAGDYHGSFSESDSQQSLAMYNWKVQVHSHGWSNLVLEITQGTKVLERTEMLIPATAESAASEETQAQRQSWMLRLPRFPQPKAKEMASHSSKSNSADTIRLCADTLSPNTHCRFELEARVIEHLKSKYNHANPGYKHQSNAAAGFSALLPQISLSPPSMPRAMLYQKLQGKPFDWRKACTERHAMLAKDMAEALANIHTPCDEITELTAYPYGDEAFLETVLPVALTLLPKHIAAKAWDYFAAAHALYEQSAPGTTHQGISYQGTTHQGNSHQSTPESCTSEGLTTSRCTPLRVTPVLCHGDFGPANVLITETGRLAGIIDFSDMCRTDPAMDLAPLWRRMPAPFFTLFLAHYQAALGPERWQALEPDSLLKRAQYYALRRAAFVLWYGTSFGFSEGLKPSIDYLLEHFGVEFAR